MELTTHQAYVQRVLAISAASLSIVSGVAVLIWWFVVPWWDNYKVHKILRDYENRRPSAANQPCPVLRPPRKRKRIRQFRHDLTIALIIMDLMKAIVLITYPIRYLHSEEIHLVEIHNTFCDAVGFLTVATIQASDFAVLALAVHTAILIFYPTFTGGLYKYRYYIYIIFFLLIPLAFAGIGMVGNSGYTFFTSWCYLVVRPIWYSLILSWIPRILIMVLIISIYFSIFAYVKIHMYHVSKAIVASSVSSNGLSQVQENEKGSVEKSEKLTIRIRTVFRLPKRAVSRVWRNIKVYLSYFPGFGHLHPLLNDQTIKDKGSSSHITIDVFRPNNTPDGNVPGRSANTETSNFSTLINEDIQNQINRENIDRFNHRRNIIERQVNSIFIYPLTYVLLYIFPLIQQFLYYTQKASTNSGDTTEPIYWLALVAAWMKPFNCFVDTCVFVIREGAIPCLSPSRRLQKRNERYGTQPPQPSFVGTSSQGYMDGTGIKIPTRPASTTEHAVAIQNRNSVTLTDQMEGDEEEYYPGGDVEIDYIIGNNSSFQNLSMTALNDEESSARFSSPAPLNSDSNKNNNSDLNHTESPTWLRKVTTPINSVSQMLRADRQLPQLTLKTTSPVQSHTKTNPTNQTTSLSRNTKSKKWADFSFTPIDESKRKRSLSSTNPMSPHNMAPELHKITSHETAEEKDSNQSLSGEVDPTTPIPSESSKFSPTNESPKSVKTRRMSEVLNNPLRPAPVVLEKLKRAATSPLHLTSNSDKLHRGRQDPQQFDANIHHTNSLQPSSPKRHRAFSYRKRANTDIYGPNIHGHWRGHSGSSSNNYDDLSNNPQISTNNDNNNDNNEKNVGEMGLKEFLDMF